MITFGKFRPTGFDRAGLGSEGREDWLVCPASHSRDSGLLETVNWEAQEARLNEADPEHEDHEEHEFSHWGPGWFKITVVRPGSKAAAVAHKIESSLADYPCLDDDRLLEIELDAVLTDLDEQLARIYDQDKPWIRVSSENVYRWLWENDPNVLEYREGCSLPHDRIKAAVDALRKAKRKSQRKGTRRHSSHR